MTRWLGLSLLLAGCQLAPAKPGVGVRGAQIALWRLPGPASVTLAPAGVPAFASVVLSAIAPATMEQPQSVTLDEPTFRRAEPGELRFLPAGPDVDVYAAFRDADQHLLALAHRRGALQEGANTLAVSWQPLAAARALSGGPGISVADGVVIKGEAVRLSTGLPDGAPGVGRVDVSLAGPAYAGGTAQIGSFRAPQLAAYTWSPGLKVGTYDPALMGGPGRQPFTLTATAYDMWGAPLGTTVVPLQIEAAALVQIGIRHQ